jgi:hypothetical protein
MRAYDTILLYNSLAYEETIEVSVSGEHKVSSIHYARNPLTHFKSVIFVNSFSHY